VTTPTALMRRYERARPTVPPASELSEAGRAALRRIRAAREAGT
jgi:hypothetical protein